jgi:hypothetical protein
MRPLEQARVVFEKGTSLWENRFQSSQLGGGEGGRGMLVRSHSALRVRLCDPLELWNGAGLTFVRMGWFGA